MERAGEGAEVGSELRPDPEAAAAAHRGIRAHHDRTTCLATFCQKHLHTIFYLTKFFVRDAKHTEAIISSISIFREISANLGPQTRLTLAVISVYVEVLRSIQFYP